MVVSMALNTRKVNDQTVQAAGFEPSYFHYIRVARIPIRIACVVLAVGLEPTLYGS